MSLVVFSAINNIQTLIIKSFNMTVFCQEHKRLWFTLILVSKLLKLNAGILYDRKGYQQDAAGQSGIVAEMLKPVGESGAVEVRHLIEDIISEGRIPTD